MNASTIRFDSIRSRKRNRHPPRAASLPRLSRVRVRSTSSPRRASPSPASSSHPPAAASTRPGPPPTPTPRITNTHTHTGLNAPRLRKTTRCLPREIKNKNTYPSHLSSVYDPSVPPSYNHTCSDIRRPTVGPDATDDRGRRGRRQIASSSRVRACVGSIDRSCASIAIATGSVRRARARVCRRGGGTRRRRRRGRPDRTNARRTDGPNARVRRPRRRRRRRADGGDDVARRVRRVDGDDERDDEGRGGARAREG